MAFAQRTFPSYANPETFKPFDGRRSGWRFLIPMVPALRHAFDLVRDGFHKGLWWYAVGVAFEPIIAGKNQVGLSIRLTAGWIAG